ncbi:hypothetical protein [Novosphingobium sp. BL-52-GroH]|uniref:hypothetical protein n=1 Tax=Novosphingobium sp. BL-52-GroH TaxID=3349877 RepID=UPI00384ED6C0
MAVLVGAIGVRFSMTILVRCAEPGEWAKCEQGGQQQSTTMPATLSRSFIAKQRVGT